MTPQAQGNLFSWKVTARQRTLKDRSGHRVADLHTRVAYSRNGGVSLCRFDVFLLGVKQFGMWGKTSGNPELGLGETLEKFRVFLSGQTS